MEPPRLRGGSLIKRQVKSRICLGTSDVTMMPSGHQWRENRRNSNARLTITHRTFHCAYALFIIEQCRCHHHYRSLSHSPSKLKHFITVDRYSTLIAWQHSDIHITTSHPNIQHPLLILPTTGVRLPKCGLPIS